MVSSTERDRWDPRPWLVALLCLAGAGTGSYLLYRDFNQSAGEGLGPPMARIERREAKVRRKPSRSFAWSNAQQDEKLFRRDSVQTSVGSAAAIRFNDGTLLELGENSLVVIDDIQKLALDFASSSIRGAVVLHTAEGDKRVTVGSDGKARIEELPIRLVRPEPLARFFAAPRETRTVRFEWKARQGQEKSVPANLALQLSPDRGFKSARVRTVPLSGAAETEAALPEGTWYWRLSEGEKALTDVGQFRVIEATPLEPTSPGGTETLTTYGEETPIPFRWQVPDEAAAAMAGQVVHELQIAKEASFKSLVAHQEIAAASGVASIRGLPTGPLFWRIQSRYGELSVLSRVERFTLLRAQRPTLAQSLPEDKKALERPPSLHFSWRSDAAGLDYVLEIKDPHGADAGGTAGGIRTRSTSYLLKSPAPGVYRWRVTALHGTEAVGETGWRSFSVFEGKRIALRAPAAGQEIFYWEKPSRFDFEWESDELLDKQPGYSYQVVVARDAEFREAVTGPRLRDTSMPSSKLKLDGGLYFWKVLVVDESGLTVKGSDAGKFAYGVYPPLKAPEAIGPESKAVFNQVEKEQDPVTSWREVKNAEKYEVTLYAITPGRATASAGADGVPAGAKVVLQQTTGKTELELKKLEPADYAWSVRAIDRLGRKGSPTPPRPFTITYGDVLGAPKVISPEVQ